MYTYIIIHIYIYIGKYIYIYTDIYTNVYQWRYISHVSPLRIIPLNLHIYWIPKHVIFDALCCAKWLLLTCLFSHPLQVGAIDPTCRGFTMRRSHKGTRCTEIHTGFFGGSSLPLIIIFPPKIPYRFLQSGIFFRLQWFPVDSRTTEALDHLFRVGIWPQVEQPCPDLEDVGMSGNHHTVVVSRFKNPSKIRVLSGEKKTG